MDAEVATRVRTLIPSGRTLPTDAWRSRHHAMVGLLLVEAVGLALFGVANGNGVPHSIGHAAPLVPIAIVALVIEDRRRPASLLMSLGLMIACALLVHSWEGAIEAHFLFFVTIVVLALYEDWLPFLAAAAFVVVHHGAAGALAPSAVYNHPDAVAHPWKWAAIHGGFVIAAGLASVAAWRLNETLRAREQEFYRRALEGEGRFQAAFEQAPIGMVLFSFDEDRGEVIQVNRAMAEIAGYSQEHLRAAGFQDVIHPDDAGRVVDAVRGLLDGPEQRTRLELRYRHAEGRIVRVVASVSLLGSEPGYAIAQVQDVTEPRRLAEELIRQALTDPLTGLGNRRSLLLDLDLRLTESTPERPAMLVTLDLDGFKSYNDGFGHAAGDALLVRMARRLEQALDGRASAYRVGGDEFCIVGSGTGEDLGGLAARVAGALRESGDGFAVTASHGAVLLPAEAATAADALRLADRRMYARKSIESRSSAARQGADLLLRLLAERSPGLDRERDELTLLCGEVAARLGLPEDDRAPLLQAASLHDAGTLALPAEVVAKRRPLDATELAFLRRHPLVGERVLSAAPALARAAKIVRSSRERFDGRGYPDGLAGARIPLSARIVAACAAYGAMTSDHREGGRRLEPAAARAELRRRAGGQFDPAVVEALCVALDGGARDSAVVVDLAARRASR